MSVHFVPADRGRDSELVADRTEAGGLQVRIKQPYSRYGYAHVAVAEIPADQVARILDGLLSEIAPKLSVPSTAQALELMRAEYAELLAHARAAVAAARLGHPAPLALLEGHLEERGQLPAAGARPEVEVARAYAASVDVYALAGVVPA